MNESGAPKYDRIVAGTRKPVLGILYVGILVLNGYVDQPTLELVAGASIVARVIP